jgi:hypothetical protein
MTLGEILDRTFQVYRSRFWVFVGIAALPALVMLGVELTETYWLRTHSPAHPSTGSAIFWNYVYWLGFAEISGFLILLVSPALVRVTSTTVLGDGISIRPALRFATARWRSYLWIAVLKSTAELAIPQILIVVLIIGEFVIAALAGGWKTPRVAGGFAAVLVVAFPVIAGAAVFLWIGPRVSLAIPVAAIEQIQGLKALQRSWTLTKGSRARILITWAMICLLSWLLMYSAGLAVRWIFIPIWHVRAFGLSVQSLYAPAVYVVWDITSALIHPILPIALTLFYYDQRIRHEGYDIERMMDAAGMIAPGTTNAGNRPTAAQEPEEVQP